MFTHLHAHTEYSLTDGLSRIRPLVQRAKELGMDALAITDHGALYGLVEFYSACKEAGIKPILGCELYVARGSRHSRGPSEKNPHHLTVVALNNIGYQNLIQLVTKAHLEGFHYRPRVDKELLEQHREGLVVLSGCPSAEIPRLIQEGRLEEAKEAARWYKETFSHFYIEVQRHGNMPLLDLLNPALIALSKELGIPLAATNDAHYILKEEAPLQDILICIHTNTNVRDEKRLKMSDDSYYLKSPQEMAELFADLPEAIANTQRIAQACNVEMDFGTLHLPQFVPPNGLTPDQYLESLCREGLRHRFPTVTPQLEERLRYELDVIRKTRFPNYFLVVWDIATFARKQGILFGVRGSAAASLVLYCLGVTDVNPMEYRLVFERFLNLERKEMPDIDMDFQDERRAEVIRYLVHKYGQDHVAQIITFGTLGAKAAVRDVGRALALPYGDVDQVARLIPFKLGITLDGAMQTSPELRQMYQNDQVIQEMIDTAKKLEGVVRHASTHAAGVVISGEPLTPYVPLQRPLKSDDEEIAMTQFSMDPIAKLGLLKMDLLGLINLTILSRARELVAKTRGTEIDLHRIPLDDAKTFQLLSSGETTGVFQLESAGMRRYIKELKPSSLRDVAAMIALYRPGPMEHIDTFIKAKHGHQQVRYPHPTLRDILEETYGVIVYQDQVLLILQALAGYTLGEADIVRKAMGKKIPELMHNERQKFIAGAVTKGHSVEIATTIFDLMEPFAGYAFNKAHSVSYALVAYWTAYFKANYPLEYMTAVLNCHVGNMEKVGAAVDECLRLDIAVLGPDVNTSELDFTASQTADGKPAIRFGLAAVKNVGGGAVRPIVEARARGGPFTSLEDFCRRGELGAINKRALESLIKVGALDSLGERGVLLASLDKILAQAQREARLRESGQATMFDLFGQVVPTPTPTVELKDAPLADNRERLAWERELLGVELSDNPRRRMLYSASRNAIISRLDLTPEMEGRRETLAGEVFAALERTSRAGQPFLVVNLKMLQGSVDVLVRGNLMEKTQALWREGSLVQVTGRIRLRDDEMSLLCDEAFEITIPTETPQAPLPDAGSTPHGSPTPPSRSVPATPLAKSAPRPNNAPQAKSNGRRKVLVSLAETERPEEDSYLLRDVVTLLLEFPGTDGVELLIATNGRRIRVDMPIVTTSYCPELCQRLAQLLGRDDAARLEE